MVPGTAPPPRRRFRPVEVVGVRRVTPRLVRVALGGEALDGFAVAAPTQHVKLLFPAPGQKSPPLPEVGEGGLRFPDGVARPVMRTFTPRHFDPVTGTLDVEFILHDEGPASAWARQVTPGQRLAVAGPGGRFPLPLSPGRFIVAGDESALPAVSTLLAALPAKAEATVFLEVDGPDDELALESPAPMSTTWLHRRPGVFGEELHRAVAGTDLTGAVGVWIAGEATAIRGIRRLLMGEQRVDPAVLVTRGYWRLGHADHPDHDHGEDAG